MVAEFMTWVRLILQEYPMVAPLIYVLVHMLMAVLILPCSPMTLMAGALWGGVYGLILSVAGALASSIATFLLSRSLLHDRIHDFLLRRYPAVADILPLASTHDWKLVAATQLNPFVPASVMGYVFGLTHISLLRYIILSAVFMLPLQVLFVYMGHTAATSNSVGDILTLIFLLIFAFLVLPWIAKHAYKKLIEFWGK
jgi:uncharacterized membrane protein YdjX (TVP38/TMEM64 family)